MAEFSSLDAANSITQAYRVIGCLTKHSAYALCSKGTCRMHAVKNLVAASGAHLCMQSTQQILQRRQLKVIPSCWFPARYAQSSGAAAKECKFASPTSHPYLLATGRSGVEWLPLWCLGLAIWCSMPRSLRTDMARRPAGVPASSTNNTPVATVGATGGKARQPAQPMPFK